LLQWQTRQPVFRTASDSSVLQPRKRVCTEYEVCVMIPVVNLSTAGMAQ
jgi:hypothetical protein